MSTTASSDAPIRPMSHGHRVAHAWHTVRQWCLTRWAEIRPGPQARRGAILGVLLLLAIAVAIKIVFLPSGYGWLFDVVLTGATTALAMAFVTAAIVILLAVLRALPLIATSILVGASIVITLVSFSLPSPSLALAVILCCLAACALGATIATLISPQFGRSSAIKKTLTVALFAVAASYSIRFVWVLADAGDVSHLSSWRPRAESLPRELSAPDPGLPGQYPVKTLFYGSGVDKRRPEYGSTVAIRTRSVNATLLLRGVGSWTRWIRKQYWGFDLDQLPLNARVWYPDGAGPFPLVLIAHGNHRMNDFSDAGYEYLGQLLASRGFILASVDQNFLNSTRGFRDPTSAFLPREQAVRGWHLLEHLRLWHEWNEQSGNPFYRKVDISRIALMGHSRGGEAAATAVAFNRMKHYPEDASIGFNYGYALQAVVAIAPADGQYEPAEQPRWIKDVSYLTLHGSHDADQASFEGSLQADRVRYSRAGPWFTTEIWAYRANHGQFNTSWGRADFPPPLSWFLNLEPLMAADDQQRIAKAYISAFLEVALNGRQEYLPLFKDWRTGRRWLPETIYVNRYRDASFVPVAMFQEDADLASATIDGGVIRGENLAIWREGRIPTRRGNRGYNGVFLGWYNAGGSAPPTYSIALPGDAVRQWHLTGKSTIEISVAALDQTAPLPRGGAPLLAKKGERDAPDFTIEVVTSDGITASAPVTRFAEIPPPLREQFTKIVNVERDRYGRDWEPVFQTVRVPLAAFVATAATPIEPTRLILLRLRFDRTPTGVVCISGIGFGSD